MIGEWPEGIAGAAELREWYGGFPSFHDAKATLALTEDGTVILKVRGHRLTDRLDENGEFILDKPFATTFLLEDIIEIYLSDFMPGEAVLFDLDIARTAGAFDLQLESSYGFSGTISAGKLSVSFEPGVPLHDHP